MSKRKVKKEIAASVAALGLCLAVIIVIGEVYSK
tara:strand:+ start:1084 stop:1185 length:102 start_codon:yes stop_codon:yes gene_type:complete